MWEDAESGDQIPDGCVALAQEMFVDAKGVPWSRGHMPQLQGSHWNTDRLTWVWEGNLTPGLRTLFASRGVPGSPGVVNAGHGMGVLDASNNSAARITNNTVFFPSGYYYLDYPTSWTVLDSMLFIGNQAASPATSFDADRQGMVYGGSRKAAAYSPGGTVAVTNGSKIVTRAAGGFTANVDVGMVMISGAVLPKRYYVVASVDTDTQVTLLQPWEGATNAALSTPSFDVIGQIGAGSLAKGYRASALYGSVAGRLLSLEGNKLYASDGPDPTTGASRAHSFPTKNIIEFPLDAQGVAIQTIRNQVFVFTTQGLYRVTGLEYEIVDPDGNPQWTIELLSRELVALSNASIVVWHQALVVPCVDGIYIVDGVNPPQLISAGVDWSKVVNAGRNLGQAAVYQGFYLLPVETSAGSFVYTTYCFRLQATETARGLVFPNTRWACNVGAYYSSGARRLLAAEQRIWNPSAVFDTSVALGQDGANAVGDAVSTVTAQVGTRPFLIGAGGVARRVRVRAFRTNPAGAVSGTVAAAISGGAVRTFADAARLLAGADEWEAYDLSAPLQWGSLRVNYSLSDRWALFGVELQFRAAGWPSP